MSKRKTFLPGTYVLGSSVVLDHNAETNRIEPVIAATTMTNAGHGDVPYVRKGDPMWRKPKPMGFVQHFRSAAAKKAVVERLAAQGITEPSNTLMLKAASPKELKIVPLYRGISSRFANQIRSMKRRHALKEAERKANAPSLVDRAKAALGLSAEDGTKYA